MVNIAYRAFTLTPALGGALRISMPRRIGHLLRLSHGWRNKGGTSARLMQFTMVNIALYSPW